jgi:hypothetical protein
MTRRGTTELGPRDIIMSISTLLGLLVVAVGFLHSYQASASQVKNLTEVIIAVAFTFIMTVLVAVAFALTGNRDLWILSVRMYLSSWVIFGLGMIIIIAFQGLGNFTWISAGIASVNVIGIFTLLVFFFLALSLGSYFIYFGKPFSDYIWAVQKSGGNMIMLIEEASNLLVHYSGDSEVAFLKLYDDIHSLLRMIGQKKELEGPNNFKKIVNAMYKGSKDRRKRFLSIDVSDNFNKLYNRIRKGVLIDEYIMDMGIRSAILFRVELTNFIDAMKP